MINIQVNSRYLPEQSQPEQSRYAYMYHITITNQGPRPAQLLRRHWIITDGNNKVREVKGEGVIGEQPIIEPGNSFSYQSGAILETPTGTMEGHYFMSLDNGELFEAPIAPFGLTHPKALH